MDVQCALLKRMVIASQKGLGLDMNSLKEKEGCEGCGFMITEIDKVRFIDELVSGDEIRIETLVWIEGKYDLKFFVRYFKGNQLMTRGFSTAHLIRLKTAENPKGSLTVLPESVIRVIGTDKPSDSVFR